MVLAVAVAVGAFISSTAVAAADRPAVKVTLHEPGGVVEHPSVVTIEKLGGCTRYGDRPVPALYGPDGRINDQPPGPMSWSLAAVLDCGLVPGVPPKGVTALTIHELRSGSVETGTASILSAADLSPPGDFPDAALPLITFDGSNVIYYRPWRGVVGGIADQNYRDKVEEPDPSPVAIDVYEGPPLNVHAQATSTTVTAGASVGFSAVVSDGAGGAPPDPTSLVYSWDFGGGATSSMSAAPKVFFPNAGIYSVTVQVTDSAGGGGADATLITVNPAANTPPTSTSPANASQIGPAQSGGSTPGAVAGKKTPTHGVTVGRRPPAKVTHRTIASKPAKPRVVHRAAVHPPVAPALLPEVPASTPVRRPRKGTGGSGSGGPTIVGRLLSGVAPVPLDASPLVRTEVAAPATAPQARPPSRASILPILAVALTIVLLLGLGARHQSGWRRRPRAVLVGG